MSVDKLTSERLKSVYPDLERRALLVYEGMEILGFPMKCAEGLRSFEDQSKAYAQGRTAPGKKITRAVAGDSLHQYGAALDSCFKGSVPYPEDPVLWAKFGQIAKNHGFEWGGLWPARKRDQPHIQLTYGLSLEKIKQIYQAGGLHQVWKTFDEILAEGKWVAPT